MWCGALAVIGSSIRLQHACVERSEDLGGAIPYGVEIGETIEPAHLLGHPR